MVDLVEYIIDLGFGSIVILVGLITNGVSARVFWHQGFHQHHVNVTLLALALNDLTCLALAVIYRVSYLLDLLLSESEMEWWFKWVILPFGLTQVAMARVTFSLTALLSLERWISVCHPLQARNWLKRSQLIRATIITAVTSIALNVPGLVTKTLMYAHKTANKEQHNSIFSSSDTTSTHGSLQINSSTILTPKTQCNDHQFPMIDLTGLEYPAVNITATDCAFSEAQGIYVRDLGTRVIDMLLVRDATVMYILVFTLVVFTAICNVVVVFCTVAIIRKLRKMGRKRLSLSETSSDSCSHSTGSTRRISLRESRVVKSTLAVMIIFILCHTPTSVWGHVILIDELKMLDEQRTLHLYFLKVFMFLETLNSSVNFFVYITCFPGFRRTFNLLYSRCFVKK